MSFSPYLFFSGNCAEAFTWYQEVFGGELNIMRNSDVPAGEEGMTGASPDAVMHASVKVGDGFLMGSDDTSGDGGPRVGSAVAYTGSDAAKSERVFNALCEGGQTTMPFGQTFWSQGFGMCTDRFGVPWMVDTAGEPPSS